MLIIAVMINTSRRCTRCGYGAAMGQQAAGSGRAEPRHAVARCRLPRAGLYNTGRFAATGCCQGSHQSQVPSSYNLTSPRQKDEVRHSIRLSRTHMQHTSICSALQSCKVRCRRPGDLKIEDINRTNVPTYLHDLAERDTSSNAKTLNARVTRCWSEVECTYSIHVMLRIFMSASDAKSIEEALRAERK